VTEVNSGKQVTVYNQDPLTKGKFDNFWSNRPEEDTTYNGSDVTVNKRMSHHWSLTGGASFGHTTGGDVLSSAISQSDLNNPNSQQFRQGVWGLDVPWSYRMSGAYELPFGISASGTYQFLKGAPEVNTVSVGNNTVALTQSTTILLVAPRGNTRLPNIAQLDFSLRKNWRHGGRTFEPRVDFYNLTNQASIINRVTQFGPAYDRASSIQRGRLIKLGVTVEF
jgi:hypothetical protein